jgi:hypothetical protein
MNASRGIRTHDRSIRAVNNIPASVRATTWIVLEHAVHRDLTAAIHSESREKCKSVTVQFRGKLLCKISNDTVPTSFNFPDIALRILAMFVVLTKKNHTVTVRKLIIYLHKCGW